MGEMAKCETIKKRSVFLEARAKGRSFMVAGFILQVLEINEENKFLVGFTASKKIGNAVVRNRARRRLKALVQKILPARAKNGFAYVFIAKKATLDRPFERLEADLKYALHQV